MKRIFYEDDDNKGNKKTKFNKEDIFILDIKTELNNNFQGLIKLNNKIAEEINQERKHGYQSHFNLNAILSLLNQDIKKYMNMEDYFEHDQRTIYLDYQDMDLLELDPFRTEYQPNYGIFDLFDNSISLMFEFEGTICKLSKTHRILTETETLEDFYSKTSVFINNYGEGVLKLLPIFSRLIEIRTLIYEEYALLEKHFMKRKDLFLQIHIFYHEYNNNSNYKISTKLDNEILKNIISFYNPLYDDEDIKDIKDLKSFIKHNINNICLVSKVFYSFVIENIRSFAFSLKHEYYSMHSIYPNLKRMILCIDKNNYHLRIFNEPFNKVQSLVQITNFNLNDEKDRLENQKINKFTDELLEST